MTAVLITRGRGCRKRAPGGKPLTEDWGEHKKRERALEERHAASRLGCGSVGSRKSRVGQPPGTAAGNRALCVGRNKLQQTTNVPSSMCPTYTWTTQEQRRNWRFRYHRRREYDRLTALRRPPDGERLSRVKPICERNSLGSRLRSYCDCMFIDSSGVVPKATAIRMGMAAEIPAFCLEHR